MQAELYLLLHICQNPNDMFLTGDTAQGIMRGISFRFKDLRSLFYHAGQTMKTIKVPERVNLLSLIVIMLLRFKITLFRCLIVILSILALLQQSYFFPRFIN